MSCGAFPEVGSRLNAVWNRPATKKTDEASIGFYPNAIVPSLPRAD